MHLNPLEEVPRPPAAAATAIAAGKDEAPDGGGLPPLPVSAFVGELAAALSGAHAEPEEMA